MEDTAQQVDSSIAAWMECVTVNIIWKLLHSRWTVVLQLECSVLQWTLYWKYFTAGGQCYCRLNGVCYSEHYFEILDHEDLTHMRNGILIYYFACHGIPLTKLYITFFDSIRWPVGKQTQLSIPLVNIRYSFPHKWNRPNTENFICCKIETISNFDFRGLMKTYSKLQNSGVSFILFSTFERFTYDIYWD